MENAKCVNGAATTNHDDVQRLDKSHHEHVRVI